LGRPNPVDIHVGERLRLRRILLGFSQETLGAMMGLTFQQIQKYESGANRIGASRLYDLAGALDVSVNYFYEEMSPVVMAASPRHMTGEAAEPELPQSPQFNSRETLDLLRAYFRINDPSMRRTVHTLAQALSEEALAHRVEMRRLSLDSDGPLERRPDLGE
jgi:transcriptional regulator with XRE-family HTH domain